MVITVLSFLCPGEGDRLAVFAARELSERAHNMRIFGDESCRLHKNAQGLSHFGDVGGRDHAADRVEIFVCEPGARLVHGEPEEGTRGKPDVSFGCIESPIFSGT